MTYPVPYLPPAVTCTLKPRQIHSSTCRILVSGPGAR